LILHAGLHKTGTTAIQQFAARNRRRLLAGGFLYPRLWPAALRPVAGHHFLFHAVAGRERHLTLVQAHKLVRRWHRRAIKADCCVLLSSEAICRYMPDGRAGPDAHGRRFVERLLTLLSDFDVRPVLVVRRQDDFVRSLYQEHVAAGTGASACSSFSDYLSAAAADKARFLERLRVFRETFGSVSVLVYEELADRTLPVQFLQRLGVGGLDGCHTRAVRRSLSVAETLVKQRLNAWITGRQQNRLVLLWLRSRAVQRVLQRTLGGCNTLWPDGATRVEFLARFDAENRLIAREFLGRDDRLFPPLGESSTTGVPPPEGEAVADAMQQAVTATRWRLQAIIGRKAVSELTRRTTDPA